MNVCRCLRDNRDTLSLRVTLQVLVSISVLYYRKKDWMQSVKVSCSISLLVDDDVVFLQIESRGTRVLHFYTRR